MKNEQFLSTIIGTMCTKNENKIYTEDEINNLIDEVASLSFYKDISDDEIEQVKKYIHSRELVKLDIGTVLTSKKHKKWFMGIKSQLPMNYWNRYSKYLLYDKKFPNKVINSMDDVSDEIVDLLGNPKDDFSFQRRGLVVGDVQSGKTANYVSVINKAADVGYKIIVLLTGTIEKLRKQTQIRIDEGFIGKTSDDGQKIVGVGKYDSETTPSYFTNVYNDFKSTSTKVIGVSLDNLTDTCILVIKKNVSVLRNLNHWIKSRNLKGGNTVINNSLLVIDDEADNASINTNDEDKSPTRINEQIRILLNCFTKTSYIGFTATPYANIFIDPNIKESDMLADDLYPRDYIYCLDAPSNYIGARDIYGIDSKYNYMLEEITDAEDYYPQSHKKDFYVEQISPSLEEALYQFYLSNVIRDLRGDITKHRSMLINISRFIDVQRQLGDLVNEHLKKVKNSIRLYSKLDVSHALQNEEIKQLKIVYENTYSDIPFSWELIQKNLIRAIEPIQVFVVNKNTNELDYEANEVYGLRAICVGGFSLSRGLTLEGLIISYFYRNSKIYDTLMQMGRWFGYRGGYEDLCRIWMSSDSIDWYKEISDATDELRHDIKIMKENGGTPKDFGLRVRRDSNILMITARNKMRTAKIVPLIVSLSGEYIETPKLYNNYHKNLQNYEIIMEFIKSEKMNNEIVENLNSNTNFGFRNIPKEHILELLNKIDVSRANIKYDKESITNFICNYKGNELNKWDMVFLNGVNKEAPVKIDENHTVYRMKRVYQLRNENKLIQISKNKNRLGTSSDATFGLSCEQVNMIKEVANKRNINEKSYFGPNIKRNPLIMIYFVGLKPCNLDDKLDKNLINIPLIGISIGIPTLLDEKTKYATYILNVKEQQNYSDYEDEFGDESYE